MFNVIVYWITLSSSEKVFVQSVVLYDDDLYSFLCYSRPQSFDVGKGYVLGGMTKTYKVLDLYRKCKHFSIFFLLLLL